MDQIRSRITGRIKPREGYAVLRCLSLRTCPNRNQQISSFTDIIDAELDLNWTKRHIGNVFDAGKQQMNRALRVIADDNLREQPGRLHF
jgi:hypothetical protein